MNGFIDESKQLFDLAAYKCNFIAVSHRTEAGSMSESVSTAILTSSCLLLCHKVKYPFGRKHSKIRRGSNFRVFLFQTDTAAE